MSALNAALAVVTGNDIVSAKVRGLMRGYDATWGRAQQQFEVIDVESVVTSDLWNPKTQRKSRSFTVAGKIDVRATRNGRNVIIDHKTCSEDIADPQSPYWRQLVIEAQPSHYMLVEWLNGRKVDEAVWDVIRKPDISPKKLTKSEANAAATSRWYYSYRLTDEDVMSLNADGRETLSMYEARLAHDCSAGRPERYFQRRTVPRLDNEIIEYAEELWDDGQEILHVRATERHRRNSGACMNYGRPCTYLGICSGYSEPEGDQWRRKEWVHPELPPQPLGRDGRDVLTHSRISTLQTCRRKHYYRFEMGIERAEDDEAESLYLGNLMHLALEKWWGFFIRQETANNGNDAVTSSGSELETACAG